MTEVRMCSILFFFKNVEDPLNLKVGDQSGSCSLKVSLNLVAVWLILENDLILSKSNKNMTNNFS